MFGTYWLPDSSDFWLLFGIFVLVCYFADYRKS